MAVAGLTFGEQQIAGRVATPKLAISRSWRTEIAWFHIDLIVASHPQTHRLERSLGLAANYVVVNDVLQTDPIAGTSALTQN
jgi:hypothetical protein